MERWCDTGQIGKKAKAEETRLEDCERKQTVKSLEDQEHVGNDEEPGRRPTSTDSVCFRRGGDSLLTTNNNNNNN